MFSTKKKLDEFFSGQIFRQATRIPDARGGRAPNSHGGFNPGTQRKEGSASEKMTKNARILENGRHWERLTRSPWDPTKISDFRMLKIF